MTFELITTRTEGRVGIVTLNRPKQLNALNDQLMTELGTDEDAYETEALRKFRKEPAQMKLLIVVSRLLTGFDAPTATEPRRVCRRLQLLSRMEHHEQNNEQVFP